MCIAETIRFVNETGLSRNVLLHASHGSIDLFVTSNGVRDERAMVALFQICGTALLGDLHG